jgi:uncharacterized protein
MWMGAHSRSTPDQVFLGKVCVRASESDLESATASSSPPRASEHSRREAMSNAGNHHKINYIEFHSTDIEQAKKFYAAVFGWSFVDYGPDYVSFQGAGIDGGFIKSEPHDGPGKFAPLVVLYSSDLAATEIAIRLEGGGVVVPTFEFPGGRRFHFSDGAGNVLAVWSE